MTPVDFMLCVAILVGSACLMKGWWTACDQLKELVGMLEQDADGQEVLVKCGVCGWQCNAVFDEQPDFPMECHNCGVNAVEPVESGDDE